MILGIDTSNYKTSLAVIDHDKNILWSRSEFLDVKKGERGLRQSDAFFLHSNKLPEFIDELFSNFQTEEIEAIGVSSAPRRVEGSYMPCFLAGLNLAKELSLALKIPYYQFSHQEGHAAAILEKSDKSVSSPTIFGHLSGGTTEFLLLNKDEKGYKTEIIGGTKDISIGQLLDRIGVALGMDFPAGRYLDEISSGEAVNNGIIPDIKIDDGYFNLSGIETKIIQNIKDRDQESINLIIKELFYSTSKLLIKECNFLKDKYDIDEVHLSGGVASSSSIRKLITDPTIKFGDPELSGDNAVGIAILASRLNFKE